MSDEPEDPAVTGETAADAGRSRRPTSLRDQYVQDTEAVPRRRLSAPAFPGAPAVPGAPPVPGADVQQPVSESAQPGNPGDVSSSGHSTQSSRVPNPAALLGKLPTDRLPAGRLSALVRQRPEVGLGLAFAGGLVIATILKRLGRR